MLKNQGNQKINPKIKETPFLIVIEEYAVLIGFFIRLKERARGG